MSHHSPSLPVRRAAVLGAGVMGAQIAAHLVNAQVETLLFELPAKQGDPNAQVNQAIAGLTKLSPSPLGTKSVASQLIPANYDQHLPLLAGCDLIIEAIAERMDWKKALYERIAPHLNASSVIASNTSGLSITALGQSLPTELHARFLGIHFFNPPRYMPLVELIPTASTDPKLVDQLESFLTTALGKSVVRAKDTPNFIGNRIGVFSIVAALYHTERLGLGFDEVDAITGKELGRPKSATYRTCDVVGLDTMGNVIKTMADTLPDDPWHSYFKAPDFLHGLIEAGALGQKTRAGFYKKVGDDIQVLDLASRQYRASQAEASDAVFKALRKKTWGERLAVLRAAADSDKQADFLWSCFRDLFHYAAFQLAAIADNARDLDNAIRWGYGWDYGPFEIWQAAGWQQVASWIADDIAAGKTMSGAPLPAWVVDGRTGVHGAGGSYAPTAGGDRPRSSLPVYGRQRFPDRLYGEPEPAAGQTVLETDGVRVFSDGDDVAVLSFKSKGNTIGPAVIDGIHQAIDIAERDFAGLVIWQHGDDFSLGADLSAAMEAAATGKLAEALEPMVARFQQTAMRIKYAQVPVLTAPRGKCLGGGCEFNMHAARVVPAFETYIGLVEAGVGLLPAGGGLKEFAVRASLAAGGGDVFPHIQKAFQTVAMATVATSALEAREHGFFRDADPIAYHGREQLHIARGIVRQLADAGYRPPMPARQIVVAGDVGIASLKAALVNMLEGRQISEHDFEIASRIATVLCGGAIERGSVVDEQWLLDLEREHFVALALMRKTQERIAHTLKTGKPLRN